MTTPTANTNPIFSAEPVVGAVAITAANTNGLGTGTIGTDIFRLLSPSTDGTYLSRIQIFPSASVANTATNATIFRAYITSITGNNATTGGTNTFLIGECYMPGITADSSTAQNSPYVIPLGFALSPTYGLIIASHVTIATNTQWHAVVFGGNY